MLFTRNRSHHQRRIGSRTGSRATIFFLALMCAVFSLMRIVQAGAGCPAVDPSTKGWLRNSIVYYDVDALPEKIKIQVVRAIATWNDANKRNNSGVSFKEKQKGGTVDYVFRLGRVESNPSITYITRDDTMLVLKAETVISARDNGFYSSEREGYESVFEKVTLHEIGHTMGLDDVAVTSSASVCGGQIPRTSVMNSFCGVNDSGNNVPTYPSACDQRAVKENFDSQTQLSPSLKSKDERKAVSNQWLAFGSFQSARPERLALVASLAGQPLLRVALLEV